MSETGSTTATRIAAARKLAGLTQEALAARVAYSPSLVRKVEQGVTPPSAAFLASVAAALRVDPEELTGAPFLTTIEQDGPLVGMSDLRAVLTEGRHVRADEPGTISALRAELAAVDADYRNDRGRQALERLPGLLRRLHGTLRNSVNDEDRDRIHSLLAGSYVTAERLCRRFGFMTLAGPALDRMEEHAASAADPLYQAQALIKRCRLLMYVNAFDVGLPLVERGIDAAQGTSEAATAVRGYGHLAGAVAAARARRPDRARDHIAEARRLAATLDGESDAYGTLFGPANVGIHACAVELEAGDPGLAAREGSALRLPPSIAPPRAGHHWQDVARSWLLSGEPQKALEALSAARRVAPQQTRLHPGVRETLRGIAGAERRRTDSLSNFTNWLGVSA